MNRPTYTLKPDLPDSTNGHRDIEAMQEEYLTERIGWSLYGALCMRIREEEINVRTQLRTRQR